MRVVHAQKRLESSIGQAPAGTKAPSQEELAVVKDLRGDPLRYRAELCISWVSTFGDQIRLCGGAIPCSQPRAVSFSGLGPLDAGSTRSPTLGNNHGRLRAIPNAPRAQNVPRGEPRLLEQIWEFGPESHVLRLKDWGAPVLSCWGRRWYQIYAVDNDG